MEAALSVCVSLQKQRREDTTSGQPVISWLRPGPCTQPARTRPLKARVSQSETNCVTLGRLSAVSTAQTTVYIQDGMPSRGTTKKELDSTGRQILNV